jgi:hypothetical protein
MTDNVRFRDAFRQFTVPWLLDRVQDGLVTGFELLWTMIAPLDNAMEVLVQGLQAPWPGQGTPTALAQIGRSRGIRRGQSESDENYIARMLVWLDRARDIGSAESIALAVHEFLEGHPRVRVVNRAGHWVTCETDGTFTFADTPFDWDSVSHPVRNDPDFPWWSNEWVIVYSTPWAITGNIGDPGLTFGHETGIGHLVGREDYDAIRALIASTKAAHSKVRAVIWSYNDTDFDPAGGGLMPDGTWGAWGFGDPRTPTRDTSCRFWEPR